MEIRRNTKVSYITRKIATLKWQWAGHIAERIVGICGQRWMRRTDHFFNLGGLYPVVGVCELLMMIMVSQLIAKKKES